MLRDVRVVPRARRLFEACAPGERAGQRAASGVTKSARGLNSLPHCGGLIGLPAQHNVKCVAMKGREFSTREGSSCLGGVRRGVCGGKKKC